MARWTVRHHDDESSAGRGLAFLAVGLVAGLAAGAYLAHRLGGVTGISERVRRSLRRGGGVGRDEAGRARGPERRGGSVESGARDMYDDADEYDEYGVATAAVIDEDEMAMGDEDMTEDEDVDAFTSADPALEDRVLEAFNNDPVLCERAIDIGAVSAATIELTGTVYTTDEYERANVVTRGVPGVETVVNRLRIRAEEVAEDSAARRYADGDPRLTEARWESEIVGTGRTRQGTSQDPGRHADPKVPLEDRALREQEALRQAADDLSDVTAQPRPVNGPGDRTGGSPIAPTGVPKADHVDFGKHG